MARKKTISKKVHNSPKWFVKVRGSYLPNSWQGWLTYIPFVAYLVSVMMSVSDQDLSWFNKFMMIFVQFIAAAIVMTWIASKHS